MILPSLGRLVSGSHRISRHKISKFENEEDVGMEISSFILELGENVP